MSKNILMGPYISCHIRGKLLKEYTRHRHVIYQFDVPLVELDVLARVEGPQREAGEAGGRVHAAPERWSSIGRTSKR